MRTTPALRNHLLASLMLFTGACTVAPETTHITGSTMGTTYSVKVVRPSHEVQVLKAAIDQRLEAVNDQMSTWRAGSEISRFNANESTAWFPVSQDFLKVTRRALELGRLTDGALDITVMPLVELWGFGPAFNADAVPDAAAIEAVLPQVGTEKIETRTDAPALRKVDLRTRIDLSAIAKGFGVDAVAEVLSGLGYRDFLVEVGGEVRGSGLRPDGSPWRVAVERPVAGERAVELVVPLRDAAIATSGDYRNFFDIDGKRYPHVIDPRTGSPPDNGVGSVTVVTADTTTADGLATGLMVMGTDAGLALAEREGLAVLFILRGSGGFEIRRSSAFEALAAGR
jgi:thiamine biosynthesis lipoprotein